MATSSSSSSSATSLQLQSLLIGRKYPFIFALSALLITVTVLFFTTTDSTTFTSALSFFRPSSLSSQDDTTDSSSKYNRNDVDIDSRNSNDNINTTTTIPPVISDNINTNTVVAPVVSYVPPPFPSQNSTVNSNDRVNRNNNKNINKNDDNGNVIDQKDKSVVNVKFDSINWVLCKGAVAVDYIPCLDNFKAIKQLQSRRHMEHRERHCPDPPSRCLTPLPVGYKLPVPWPKSRDMIWYDNVPHPKLTQYKKDQNWVRKTGDYFHFPGGGTQFKGGVTHYVEFIEKTFPAIEWGKRIRVILDVGCGVASFGGYLLDKNVITMSIAPKDEHEAQIQFALERGIPATLSVIGTQKLTFPDDAYDLIHCARCRVHWDADGGKPLMELNRILRPGGFFVWSATPVYRNDERDSSVWNAMVALTESMCWKTVAKTFDSSARVGFVIYQKPVSYSCYEKRRENKPPLCDHKDRLNSSWYVPIPDCLSRLPEDNMGKLSNWPMSWPQRLGSKPTNLFGGPDAEEAWNKDMQYWSALVKDVYLAGLAINWSSVRNVMDMNAGFGGFAAALIDLPLWVMNVVPIDVPDTLPVIFDRGLIGVYHDWCESLNTYPRTYDLLHSSYILRNILQRCDIIAVSAEIDRIMRPGGYILVQDTIEMINMFSPILRSLEWSINIHQDRFLVGQKGFWRPPADKRQ